MHFLARAFAGLIVLYLAGFDAANAQSDVHATHPTNESLDRSSGVDSLLYTTIAYKAEATRLLIAEANDVAYRLHLPERLPIRQQDLIYTWISAPKIATINGGIGTIGTSNYEYSVSEARRLSFITSQKLDSDEARNDLKTKYLWPIEWRNTNTACQLAMQWLAAIQMDVKKIERDCNVYVWSWTPDGVDKKHFVPIYWVYWMKRGEQGNGSVASVELLEPTRLLGQLRVERPEYILRKPVEITNADALLSSTNISIDVNRRK